MKASYESWPSHPPEHSLLVRDSKMGNCLRKAHRLLGYRHRQEHLSPSLYYGRVEAQLNCYLIHLFQDRGFSLSRHTTSHSLAASVRHGLTAPSSALLAPHVSSPCLDTNGGIGPLAIGSSNWLTLRLP